MSHQNKQQGDAHTPPGLPPPGVYPRFHSQQDQSGSGNGQQNFRNRHEFIKGVYQVRNGAETLPPGMENGCAARRLRMKAGRIARGQQKKGPSQRMESPANEKPARENHSPAAGVKPVHEQHAQGSGNLVLIRHAGGKSHAAYPEPGKRSVPNPGSSSP